MDVDQLQAMRTMMSMFMTEDVQLKMFGRKIDPLPDFCNELLQDGGGAAKTLPLGVDVEWGTKYLRAAYEQSYNLPHTLELCFKTQDYSPSPQDIVKRLGTNHPRKLEWYFENAHIPGSVYPTINNAYTSLMRHSYSNQAYRKEMLTRGTTHVAVGFVDLGLLFAADLIDPPNWSSVSKGGPLRFLGIEMSPYSVAKTRVIWEMLKQTPPTSSLSLRNGHIRSIAQVWFSATWTKGTHEAVQSALQVLRLGCIDEDDASLHPSVRELLDYWSAASSMSLRRARSVRAKAVTNANSFIASLQRRCDRVAMAKYELTGDFAIAGNEPCEGNIVMLDCPDGTAPLDHDESVFSALNWTEIVARLSSTVNVVEAAEAYAMASIAKLADWAVGGDVCVDLVCCKVEDMIGEIAASKPWAMSWSNVLDYMDHFKFHSMARECSVYGDTVHFGYSMNWVMYTTAVNIIDYGDAELRTKIIDLANKNVEQAYKGMHWDKYLRLPPPTNPINTTSTWGLEHVHWRAWVRYFNRIGLQGGPCTIMNQEHAFGVPLSNTGASTIALTWTYDPDITPNAISTPDPVQNLPFNLQSFHL